MRQQPYNKRNPKQVQKEVTPQPATMSTNSHCMALSSLSLPKMKCENISPTLQIDYWPWTKFHASLNMLSFCEKFQYNFQAVLELFRVGQFGKTMYQTTTSWRLC